MLRSLFSVLTAVFVLQSSQHLHNIYYMYYIIWIQSHGHKYMFIIFHHTIYSIYIYTYFWKWSNTLHDDLQCNHCMYLYCKCYLGSFPSCTSCYTPTVEARTTSGDMRHRADSCFDMDRRLRMVTCSSLRCRTRSVVGRERGHLKFLKHNTTSL